MHQILAKFDDLGATIGASTDVSYNFEQAARRTLDTLAHDIGMPEAGSTMSLADGRIADQPDLAYAEINVGGCREALNFAFQYRRHVPRRATPQTPH